MNGRENKTCTTYQAAVQQPVWTALGPAKTGLFQAFCFAATVLLICRAGYGGGCGVVICVTR